MLQPQDCIFMFCLPLTEEEFLKDAQELKKDFVRVAIPEQMKKDNIYDGERWNEYKKQVVEPYYNFKNTFSKFGFTIIDHVTFDIFIKKKDMYHVNIIFSHCKKQDEFADEAIEFFDRIVYTDEFVNAIPLEYNKIIDLCVCHPKRTSQELHDRRRLLIVKSSEKKVSLMLWFYFYSIAFKFILEKKFEYYPEVLEQTINKIYKKK